MDRSANENEHAPSFGDSPSATLVGCSGEINGDGIGLITVSAAVEPLKTHVHSIAMTY